MRRWVAAGSAVLAASLALTTTGPTGASAAGNPFAPGSFNGNFGFGGGVNVPGVATLTGAAAVPSFDPNAGDIATSGYDTSSAHAILYSPSGATVSTAHGFAGEALAVAVVPPGPANAGDVVIAGYESNPGVACGSTSKAAVIQEFTQAGAPVFTTLVDCGEFGRFLGVAADSSGAIVAAGFAFDRAAGDVPATLVARLTPTGALDPSFTSTGYYENDLPGATLSQANAVTLVGTGASQLVYLGGSAVFSGATGQYMYLARLAGQGAPLSFAPDPTFGSNHTGVTEEPLGAGGCTLCSSGNSVLTLPSGNIVVAGTSSSGSGSTAELLQYLPSGVLDGSFGSGGVVTNQPAESGNEGWNAVTYQPNQGLLTAAGFAGPTSNTSLFVGQFFSGTGQVNRSFGSNGAAVRTFPEGSGSAAGVVALADGSTVAAGDAPTIGNSTQGTLLGLTGPLITVFVPAPLQVTAFGPATVNFIITISEVLQIASPGVLCSTAGTSVAGHGSCGTVFIPAGVTAITVPVTVPVTTAVGTQQSVLLVTQPTAGVNGLPGKGSGVAEVQHLPPPPAFKGYYMVASDGGVFNFGDTKFFGSTGGDRLVKPIVGMAVRTDGKGYWLVASDGGIFAFGRSGFFGSTGNVRLDKPVVAMAATADDKGYWLVASDGGIFAYGDAHFFGSTGRVHLDKPIIAISRPLSDGMAVLGGRVRRRDLRVRRRQVRRFHRRGEAHPADRRDGGLPRGARLLAGRL